VKIKILLNKIILVIFVTILFFSFGIFSCTSQKYEEEARKQKIGVVVSILPQADFVEKVGGGKVSIAVMVPPGASPHTYEPKPSQMEDVGKAEIYVKVGSGIEFELNWIDKIVELNKEMIIVDCSSGIELIEFDPHIWLSPKNAKIMVENIYNGLVRVDPENKKYYKENKENYLKELDKLDNEITQALLGKVERKIMVYHPAWSYFARDYNLEQIPVEEGGKEPSPKDLENFIKQAKENSIKIIFASPEFSTKSAEVIASEIGGAVVLISPLEKDYVNNISKVTKVFKDILE
jgi:zinc transport system substrate-binding protein